MKTNLKSATNKEMRKVAGVKMSLKSATNEEKKKVADQENESEPVTKQKKKNRKSTCTLDRIMVNYTLHYCGLVGIFLPFFRKLACQ